MKKTLLVAATVLALTTGCDDDDLLSGTVYDKKYTAEHNVTTQICTARNKNGICIVWVPQTTHYKAKWEICFEEGKARNCVDVSKDTYDEYNEGDHYPH